ncbi:UDP-galactose/UDP-glucose transporter 5B-like isoform X1 [Hibiscus syriacus]|uniref:UDP-galactose/UDP-glucose transporter 5B-like isoform X1 n=1 Tax=Hibiscus syriacus TaxID=106335 RepID=A0A6A2ZEE1_HIBSY|nr:UDP-galactose/UDP-glucose transporter 5B-like isoform X1 [Hibiscus syriacus]
MVAHDILTFNNGIFTGFTTDFVKRAWDVDDDTAKALIGNQKGQDIVKLDASVKMHEPKPDHREGMALNCEKAPLDTYIKNAGNVVLLNTKNLPLVGQVGLGADLVREVVVSKLWVLMEKGYWKPHVKEGNLLIVPRFFVVSKIADPEGLSWFSIITTPNPVFTHLAGSIGAWKAISPEILQAAFKVPAETEKLFRSKRTNDAIFFPPPN